ncbi:MAG: glycosyltransferase family 39 protein [Candidatus Omnitrophota bacterium]
MKKLLWQENILAIVVILGCLGYLLGISWLKWGDLIIDTGREMYVPYALSAGRLLYRDIAYIYGPFTPYLHAFIFNVLGAHLYPLIFSGIVTTFFTGLLIYKISRVFLNTLFSIFTVATFLFVFAFGHYMYLGNYNFILPYSYSAIHALLFALAALYLLSRFLFQYKTKRKYLFLSGLFIGLSLLCRIEIGLALFGAFLIGLSVLYFSDRAFVSLPTLVLFLFMPFFMAAVFFVPLWIKAGTMAIVGKSFQDTISANLNRMNIFVQGLAGYDAVSKNLLLMVKTFLGYALISGIFLLISRMMSGKTTKLIRQWIGRIALSVLLFIIVLVTAHRYFPYFWQYRCLPLVCLVMLGICFFRIFKKAPGMEKNIFLFVLCVFALLLLLRIILNVSAAHYGFYLLVPGMVIYYIFFLNTLPEILRCKKYFFSGAFLVLFILFIVGYFDLSRSVYKEKTLKVVGPRGGLCFFDTSTNRRCKELIEFLQQNTNKENTLVVFPEGVAINFLSQRDNPLYYYQFLPYDLARPEIEQDIIDELSQKKVDYAVILQRSTAEYGYPVFGVHYARKLFSWIDEHYRVVKLFGPAPFSSDEFGIALLKRL